MEQKFFIFSIQDPEEESSVLAEAVNHNLKLSHLDGDDHHHAHPPPSSFSALSRLKHSDSSFGLHSPDVDAASSASASSGAKQATAAVAAREAEVKKTIFFLKKKSGFGVLERHVFPRKVEDRCKKLKQ